MKTRQLIWIVLGSFLCGLACCHLAIVRNDKLPVLPKGKTVQQQQQRIAVIEKMTGKQSDSLVQRQQALDSALQITKAKLANSNKQNHQLQYNLDKLLDKQQKAKQSNDTLALLSDCDSLLSKTADYIVATNNKDSLQQGAIRLLTGKSAISDSLVTLYKRQYTLLKQVTNETLQEQRRLETVVKNNRKIIHKQRFLSGVKTVVLAVLSAILVKQRLL